MRAFWTCSLVFLISMVSGLKISSSFNSDAPQDLFSQIAKDLSPYRKRGISDSMTNGVYCGIRDPGFRVQIKSQEVYIVGEVEGFQSRNRNIKLALVDVAAEYTDLPDVDFVVGTYDWTATEVQPALGFEEGGPVLSQVGKGSCIHLSMYARHISACRHDLLHARGLLLPEHASCSRLLLCVTCCRIVSTKESTHHVSGLPPLEAPVMIAEKRKVFFSTHHVAFVGLHCNVELFNELHHFALMHQLQRKRQRLRLPAGRQLDVKLQSVQQA